MRSLPATAESSRVRRAQQRAVAVRGPNATVLVVALDDTIASKEHADRRRIGGALPELYALYEK